MTVKHDSPPSPEEAQAGALPERAAAAAGGRRPRRKKPAGRAKLTEREKLKVWVRAGGICVLCKKYLLDGALTGLEVSLGELAHIVGQQKSARSPRGMHPMPREDRDNAENVVLACESCHEEIDDQLATEILEVERLNAIKAAHEQRIRHVTTLPDDQRSLVLRVIGKVRGNAVEVTRSTAAKTVIGAGRFPWFDLDRDRLGVEVDLQPLPGERDADETYYATACRAIDEVLDTRVHDAIRSGDVRHLSVFAFARLPLLVYLGSKLEDNCTVAVYQRHRATQDWAWDDDAEERHFTVTTNVAVDAATEAVLVCNVSGTIDPEEMPVELAGLPAIVIAPDATPSPDVVRSRASLDAFCKAVRDVNATLDAAKNVRRLHVLGALPPTAAVELGRLHDPHIHPDLVVYNRTDDGTYQRALEIS
jgi:hypothetical protein